MVGNYFTTCFPSNAGSLLLRTEGKLEFLLNTNYFGRHDYIRYFWQKQLTNQTINSRFYTETNITSWWKLRFEQNASYSVNTVKYPNIRPACFSHLKDKFCVTFVWQTNTAHKKISSRVKPESFFFKTLLLKPFSHW